MTSLADRVGLTSRERLGLLAMIAVSALLIATYTGALRGLLSKEGDEVSAIFANTATLNEGSPVRIKGVEVGTVKSIEPVDGGRAQKVVMTVGDHAGALHGDARAHIVWRTLLGGTFAVNLDPGRTGGELGSASIPQSRTTSQVELDDVTSVVDGAAREGLRRLPRALADATSRPETLAQLGRTLSAVAPSVAQGLEAVRGQEKDRDIAALLDQAEKTVSAIDTPDQALRGLVAGTAATVQTTAARQAELRTTLSRAPSVMRTTNLTLRDLDRTLALADPLVADLTGPAADVAPTLAKLRPVLVGADRLLGNAEPLLDRLRPAVRSLARTARGGLPFLNELTPSLERLDRTILPYMNEEDPDTKHSAAEMVGPALGGLGNVAAAKDPNGHYLRFPATAGSSSFYLPCQVYAGNPDKSRLLECRSFQEVVDSYLSWNPLAPAPGSAPPTRKAKNR